MKLLWTTDTHWSSDFFSRPIEQAEEFCIVANYANVDAVVHTGDIGNGLNTARLVESIGTNINIPFIFVLGNHDYWYVDQTIRRQISDVANKFQNLHYMVDGNFKYGDFEFIGEDTWYDGGFANKEDGILQLNDFENIPSMRNQFNLPGDLLATAKSWSKTAAEKIQMRTIESKNKIVILSHVPSMPINDDNQYYATSYSRELFNAIMPIEATVLSGHVHRDSKASFGRITQMTQMAEYGKLNYRIIEI